jgi:LSD1 subclass zinc finger protein
MPEGQFNCPSCRTLLKVAQPQPPGTKIKCPKCLTIFTLDETNRAEAPAPVYVTPQAPTGERRPPRERDDPGEPALVRPPADRAPRYAPEGYEEVAPERRRRGLSGLSSNYRVDVGEWFQHASANYSAVLGPMIGFTVFVFALHVLYNLLSRFSHVFASLNLLMQLLVFTPLEAGFVAVCLRQLKGKRWTFGDFFAGFEHYGSVVGSQLLLMLIAFACWLPGLLASGIAVVAALVLRLGEAPVVLIPLGLVALACLFTFIYLMIRASFFSIPLILDRGCGPLEAIQGSWRLTRGHFWGLFGVALLLLLLQLGGVLMCFIGLLFTSPLVGLTFTAGYLLVAGTRRPTRPGAEWEYEEEYRRNYDAEHFRG